MSPRSLCAALIVSALGARADVLSSRPITLQSVRLWAGPTLVTESASDSGALPASNKTHLIGGAEFTFSALGSLLPQDGPIRLGDLVGVTVGVGDESFERPNDAGTGTERGHLLIGLFDARVGGQILLAPRSDLEVGLEGGLCSCAMFDVLSDTRNFVPFAGGRVRYGPILAEAGYLQGLRAALAIGLGPVRVGAQLHLLAAQDRYTDLPAGTDHWTVSGTTLRFFASKDL